MKTDHENTKVRNHEKEKGKLMRSRVKSGELSYNGRIEIGFENPMKYKESSKSRELARTFSIKIRGGRLKQKGR